MLPIVPVGRGLEGAAAVGMSATSRKAERERFACRPEVDAASGAEEIKGRCLERLVKVVSQP